MNISNRKGRFSFMKTFGEVCRYIEGLQSPARVKINDTKVSLVCIKKGRPCGVMFHHNDKPIVLIISNMEYIEYKDSTVSIHYFSQGDSDPDRLGFKFPIHKDIESALKSCIPMEAVVIVTSALDKIKV